MLTVCLVCPFVDLCVCWKLESCGRFRRFGIYSMSVRFSWLDPNSFTLRLNLVRLYSMFSLLSGSIHLWHWRSYRLDKLYYTIVKVEKRETPPCSSATMIWSLTRWTLLVFYRPQTKFLPVLQVTRFIKSKKLKQQSTNIYCQFIFYLRITLYFVANLCNKSLDLRYT